MKIINAKNVKLSAAEDTILEEINNNPKFFIENTITIIAKKYHCSESTITRLAQKMGFGNIKFFQMFISERFNFANNYYKVRDELTLEDIIHNIRTYTMYSIHESFGELDFNMLNLLIEKLDTAKKICIFGISSNFNPASVLNDNFNCIGLNSYSCNAYYNLILILQNLTKNDLLIIISDSNQSKQIKQAILLANQLQIPVALISTDKEINNDLKINYLIKIHINSNKHNQFPETSSRTAKLFICDIIFQLFLHKKLEKIECIKQGNKIMNQWNKI